MEDGVAEEEQEPTVKEPEEMTIIERSAFAAKCKDIGNRGFKEGDWAYAVLAYQEGIRYLQWQPCTKDGQEMPGYDHGGEEQVTSDMKLACMLFTNLAAPQLKMGEAREAMVSCSRALDFDPSNIKALYRMGQAQLALGDYDALLQSVEGLLTLEPDNADAKQ